MSRKRKKRYFRIAGLALAAMALSAPVAQARVDDGTGNQGTAGATFIPGVTDFPQGETPIRARKLRHDTVSISTLGLTEPAPQAASTSGFDWSDFGLGAVAGIAVAIAGGALVLMGRPALSSRGRSAAVA